MADYDDTEASILALFQIINEVRKGNNLEYIVSQLNLLRRNPYLLDNSELINSIRKHYFNHDKDMKVMFQIIINSLKKDTSRLVKLLPNLILALQRKKRVEVNREQNLNKFISKTTIISSLLAISLGIIINININFLLKNSSWLHVYGIKRNITEIDITILLIDILVSIATGISLMIILFHSLREKKLLQTTIMRFTIILSLILISYLVMNSIM